MNMTYLSIDLELLSEFCSFFMHIDPIHISSKKETRNINNMSGKKMKSYKMLVKIREEKK